MEEARCWGKMSIPRYGTCGDAGKFGRSQGGDECCWDFHIGWRTQCSQKPPVLRYVEHSMALSLPLLSHRRNAVRVFLLPHSE